MGRGHSAQLSGAAPGEAERIEGVAVCVDEGARLLGHKVGDTLRLPLEIGGEQVKMTIKSITPAPAELIYPDTPAQD